MAAADVVQPPAGATDIMSVALQRLQDWAALQGDTVRVAIGAIPTGGFFAMILAFLKTVMASLGCPIAAVKGMVDNSGGIAAKVWLHRRVKRDGNFARKDRQQAVDASYYLLSKSSEADYAAFAAAA
jgi:hypothetical protein